MSVAVTIPTRPHPTSFIQNLSPKAEVMVNFVPGLLLTRPILAHS